MLPPVPPRPRSLRELRVLGAVSAWCLFRFDASERSDEQVPPAA